VKAKSRIIADVQPEVKEKLFSLAQDEGKSMTEILSILIESEFSRRVINIIKGAEQ
jgi:DNA topoisomerase VI subunit B